MFLYFNAIKDPTYFFQSKIHICLGMSVNHGFISSVSEGKRNLSVGEVS